MIRDHHWFQFFGSALQHFKSLILKPLPFIFLVLVCLFVFFPQIDLLVSGWFHVPGHGFPHGREDWAQFFFVWSPRLVLLWLGFLVLIILLGSIPFLRLSLGHFRRRAVFLATVILLGPGLVVSALKDTWDRARPWQIVQFEGERQFTPAWIISDQCERNCSFVSGHASGAFSLMAIAWVVSRHRRLWLLIGITWGASVGLGRIAQGGHFLSDIVFAGFIVYFTSWLLARWILTKPTSDTQ